MSEKLKEYFDKRNFDKTSEPKPNDKQKINQSHLRFVVQHHIARNDHFDFRLEFEGVLLSWAVPKGLSFNPIDKRLAVQVENHPLNYRNFEGVIPKGEYGGGVVMLWDEGTWQALSDIKKGLVNGVLKFVLNGKRLKGGWTLIKLKSKKQGENNWLLIKEKDEFAEKIAKISDFNTSIRTGRTMNEIKDNIKKKTFKNPFQKIDAQLAQNSATIPKSNDWLYEIKYDGYRIIAFIENNNVKLITRNGKNFTSYFKNIANSLALWSENRAVILDGEIVITDENGRTDFQLLQNHIKRSNFEPTYIVFDILALNGKDLRKKPLIERKEILENLIKIIPKNICYSEHIQGNGEQAFVAACNLNLEGIIGKKINSIYSGTRDRNWIKLKCRLRQEFVVGGYTMTGKKASGVSSLLLGFYENDIFVFAGRAGTGMTYQTATDLEKMLKEIKSEKCLFSQMPKLKKDETTVFVKPIIVVEIEFAEWTKENLLRQASFKGIRYDKNSKEVVNESLESETKIKTQKILKNGKTNKNLGNQILEKNILENQVLENEVFKNEKTIKKLNSKKSINVGGIKISNPNKIIYTQPEIKKIDVVNYYVKAAEYILPFLSERLVSVIRCPRGVSGSCFFKKHPKNINDGIVPIPIKNSKGETTEYFYVKNIDGLIWEAQMGTLEFHTWGSNVRNLEKPDIMVFDLDPCEGLELKKVQQGVSDLKSILDELNLVSFLKTSGGKGYHIVIPFVPSVNWENFYKFSKNITEVMVQKWPNRYTNNMRKTNRKNKIFIDWIRNGKGATSIAPYSLRAREGATVSMPIFWEELGEIAPNDINIFNAISRFDKQNPWKDFFTIQQKLKI